MLALPGLAFAVVTVTPLLVPLTARADTDPASLARPTSRTSVARAGRDPGLP